MSYAPSSTLAQIATERHVGGYQNYSALCSATGAKDLPYATAEIAAIAAHFSGDARVLPEADLAAIRESSGLRSHFHFAGHGLYDPESPLDSRLELTRKPHLDVGALFDGVVPLARFELATLSACETGLVNVSDVADEYIGLAGGFLFAGVANVLCTLWRTADIAAALLMDHFYAAVASHSNLEDRLNDVQAMRTSLAWLRELSPGRLKRHLNSPHCGFSEAAKEQIREQFDAIAARHGKTPFSRVVYWAPFIMVSGL